MGPSQGSFYELCLSMFIVRKLGRCNDLNDDNYSSRQIGELLGDLEID